LDLALHKNVTFQLFYRRRLRSLEFLISLICKIEPHPAAADLEGMSDRCLRFKV